MSKRSLRLVLVAGISLIPLFPATADVRITLTNGQVIDVPISPEEIQSITMEPGRVGVQSGLPAGPGAANLPPPPVFKGDALGVPAQGIAAAPPKSGAAFTAPPAKPPASPTQAAASPGDTKHIQVGPNREIKLPSQAAGIAKAGDIVEIDAGSYRGDVASWSAPNITIRGVGGKARLAADGANAEGKAIWVIKGHDVTVENIEFTGAAVPDRNGAGIRAEGPNLKLINCYFHDNEEGILAGDNADSVIDIENSEFARNGGNAGGSHEIYVNHIRELIIRGSYFHEGRIGHLVKTRARMNVIMGNRISSEKGDSSYKIDISNGGRTFIIGNLIEQNPEDENHTLIAYAMEGPTNDNQELYVVNNTFVNDLGSGTFIASRSPIPAQVINNLMIGAGDVFRGTAVLKNNMLAAGKGGSPKIEQSLFQSGDLKESGTKTVNDPGLVDIANYDWHLRPNSPAIGAGIDPGSAGGMSLLPTLEYAHPAHAQPVKTKSAIDIGAYQHGG